MKKHKHEIFEIYTFYEKDKPAKIEMVKCDDCGEVSKEAMSILQEREDLIFKAYGGKSPYVFIDPKTKWVEQKKYMNQFELKNQPK